MGAVIGSVLAWLAESALARVLVGAGLTLLVWQGADALVESLLTQAVASFSALPAAALQLILLTGVGSALTMLGSALLTRLAFQTGGRILGVSRK